MLILYKILSNQSSYINLDRKNNYHIKQQYNIIMNPEILADKEIRALYAKSIFYVIIKAVDTNTNRNDHYSNITEYYAQLSPKEQIAIIDAYVRILDVNIKKDTQVSNTNILKIFLTQLLLDSEIEHTVKIGEFRSNLLYFFKTIKEYNNLKSIFFHPSNKNNNQILLFHKNSERLIDVFLNSNVNEWKCGNEWTHLRNIGICQYHTLLFHLIKIYKNDDEKNDEVKQLKLLAKSKDYNNIINNDYTNQLNWIKEQLDNSKFNQECNLLIKLEHINQLVKELLTRLDKLNPLMFISISYFNTPSLYEGHSIAVHLELTNIANQEYFKIIFFDSNYSTKKSLTINKKQFEQNANILFNVSQLLKDNQNSNYYNITIRANNNFKLYVDIESLIKLPSLLNIAIIDESSSEKLLKQLCIKLKKYPSDDIFNILTTEVYCTDNKIELQTNFISMIFIKCTQVKRDDTKWAEIILKYIVQLIELSNDPIGIIMHNFKLLKLSNDDKRKLPRFDKSGNEIKYRNYIDNMFYKNSHNMVMHYLNKDCTINGNSLLGYIFDRSNTRNSWAHLSDIIFDKPKQEIIYEICKLRIIDGNQEITLMSYILVDIVDRMRLFKYLNKKQQYEVLIQEHNPICNIISYIINNEKKIIENGYFMDELIQNYKEMIDVNMLIKIANGLNQKQEQFLLMKFDKVFNNIGHKLFQHFYNTLDVSNIAANLIDAIYKSGILVNIFSDKELSNNIKNIMIEYENYCFNEKGICILRLYNAITQYTKLHNSII